MTSRTLTKDDRYRPFSNGHEFRTWLESNCCRGAKGCRNYRPNATSSRDGCPIEVHIALAMFREDESIPMRIALRGGFVEPGPNGTLVERWTDDGARIIPSCPEYRGYDEPDDGPRRGPRPPKEQMDLLDPRNTPDRTRVVA